MVAGLAVAGAVGWRSWTVRDYWYRLTGAYGEPGTPPPAYKVTYEKGTLPSRHLAEPAAYDIAYPPGVAGGARTRAGRPTPVLICLPGRGRSPGEVLQGHLRFGDYVADGIEKRGVTPFAVAAVQASDTYWHARAAGDDAMADALRRVHPVPARRARPRRARWRSWAGPWAGTGRCGRRSCTRRTSPRSAA